jgi:hypothetical protein
MDQNDLDPYTDKALEIGIKAELVESKFLSKKVAYFGIVF